MKHGWNTDKEKRKKQTKGKRPWAVAPVLLPGNPAFVFIPVPSVFHPWLISSLNFDDDGERAGLWVLGKLLDLAHLAGLDLEGLGRDAVDGLVQLAAQVVQLTLQSIGHLRLQLRRLALCLLLEVLPG